MLRQAVRKLVPAGTMVAQQAQRNIGVSAAAAQKANLDPIQQLFVDKIRDYRTKSAGGKLVDATPEVEGSLRDMLGNLERAYNAKGVDMTQFPTFNFAEPEIVWPGLTDDVRTKMYEAADQAEAAETAKDIEADEEEKFNPFEGYP